MAEQASEGWLIEFRRRIAAGDESVEMLAAEAKAHGYNPSHATAYILYSAWLNSKDCARG